MKIVAIVANCVGLLFASLWVALQFIFDLPASTAQRVWWFTFGILLYMPYAFGMLLVARDIVNKWRTVVWVLNIVLGTLLFIGSFAALSHPTSAGWKTMVVFVGCGALPCAVNAWVLRPHRKQLVPAQP